MVTVYEAEDIAFKERRAPKVMHSERVTRGSSTGHGAPGYQAAEYISHKLGR